jgi:uncharacterized protein (TIGR02453 family)
MKTVHPKLLSFLSELKEHNNREWFKEHKALFDELRLDSKALFEEVQQAMNTHDTIETMKFFRIYKDVRFSKDKRPYKINFGCSFKRATAALRGGYYIHLEPGASFLAIGFWMPNKEDLNRIRQEIDIDAEQLKEAINTTSFKSVWGTFKGESLKSAPRGYDKNHPEIELLRLKNYVFMKELTDKEVGSKNFIELVTNSFKAARPFMDVMSEILTTDLNGESIL